ncbi:MAG: hypothetical protein HY299_02790 [Verrucomicrobia bacterium]|nr:hypothetical protein [Verrucomicrobiota bacterium]
MPSEDYSRQPPIGAGFCGEGRETETEQQGTKKNTMKTPSKISNEGLLSRPEQLSTESNATSKVTKTPKQIPPVRISMKHRRKNRMLPTESVLNLLRSEAPRFWEVAEVVGKWVWIQFEGKQSREITATLSELGFHWNNVRQVWQHPCGMVSERTPFDPRKKYGSYFAADVKPA